MDERPEPDGDGVIASVRRILGADAMRRMAPPALSAHPRASMPEPDRFEMQTGLMIDPPIDEAEPASEPASDPPFANLEKSEDHAPDPAPNPDLAPDQATSSARTAIGSLRSVLREHKSAGLAVHRGGITIEDMIRDELRPMLKDWLDAHLPPLVEKIVRVEIARIVERDAT